MREPSIARGMSPNARPLDDDSASRLLQGTVHPDDAPPGYAAVAAVLNSAGRLPLAPVDEDAAGASVAAMVEVIRAAGPATAPQAGRKRSFVARLLAGKAIAAMAVIGLTATGAAAATGSLPDAVQNAVSGAVSHVGVNIPHPNHGKSAEHRQDGKDGHGQPGDNGQAPDNHGQQTSTAAHDAKDGVEEGGKVGPAVCTAVSDGRCQAGQHGGGSDDESTPPGDGHGAGQGPGQNNGKNNVTPPTTPTTADPASGDDSGLHNGASKGKSGRND